MASNGNGSGSDGLRRHDLGGQTPEQLGELRASRDHRQGLVDLHDHVIERLFAAGLDLQGTIEACRSPEVRQRLTRTVDDLQSTIEEIRTTVFESHFPGRLGSDFRQRIQKALGALMGNRDITTTLRFAGPTSVVGDDLADHIEAVITEAVLNAVGHSDASRVMVNIAIADELAIDIIDNGSATLADNQRLATTMHRRAEQIGGSCRIAAPQRAAPTCTGPPR